MARGQAFVIASLLITIALTTAFFLAQKNIFRAKETISPSSLLFDLKSAFDSCLHTNSTLDCNSLLNFQNTLNYFSEKEGISCVFSYSLSKNLLVEMNAQIVCDNFKIEVSESLPFIENQTLVQKIGPCPDGNLFRITFQTNVSQAFLSLNLIGFHSTRSDINAQDTNYMLEICAPDGNYNYELQIQKSAYIDLYESGTITLGG